jgi:predicted component of type VI protein secretion system
LLQRFLPECIAIPTILFDALRRLYFEICAFHEKQPEQPCFPYVHEGSAENFQRLFGYLEKNLIALTAPRRHVELTLRDGRFLLPAWPDELARAEKVYLLVSRNQRHERIPMDAVKIASPDRLDLVHGAALRGVPFESIPNPPSSRYFIEGMEFYELHLGDEWSHVLKSQGSVFMPADSCLVQESGCCCTSRLPKRGMPGMTFLRRFEDPPPSQLIPTLPRQTALSRTSPTFFVATGSMPRFFRISDWWNRINWL